MGYRRNENKDFPHWMYQFVLEGEEPEEGIAKNPFQALTFMGAEPHEDPARHGRGLTWFAFWEAVKNGPIVKEWRRKNPGRAPFAERLPSQNNLSEIEHTKEHNNAKTNRRY